MRTFLTFIIAAWMMTGHEASAAKRALIVAIGNYDRTNTGWHTINALNDIPIIDSMLSRNGFADKVIIKDEEATRDGVLAALKKLAQKTQPGDIVLVHFSSHGQLITDEKGANAEEAIVAWGAPASGVAGYKGEKHLLYRDIRSMRDSLRMHAGAGGDVIFFFDACHSGGLTRGRAVTRGGAAPIQVAGWKANTGTKNNAESWEADNVNGKGLAPYVAISACKSGELNSEYPEGNCGSLSYVLARAFSQARVAGKTYSQLFAMLLDDMYDINPSQHPVISGYTDRVVFAGQVVSIDPHFILRGQQENENYILSGGSVNGLTRGSTLEAYPAGIKSKAESRALFTITVEDAGMLMSEVKIDTTIAGLKYTSYWFYVKQIAFDGAATRISLDSLKNVPDIKTALNDLFKGDGNIMLTSQSPDILIGYNKPGASYEVYSGLSGALMHSLPADNEQLKNYLYSYEQAIALKKVEMANDALSFSLELKKTDGSDIKTKKEGMLTLRDGEKVKMTLRSGHEKPLYINIFNFSPDGTFELIKSDAKLTTALTIEADISQPYGVDMILAIASAEPLYLDALSAASANRSNTRGGLSSLQKIFHAPATRGAMPGEEDGYTARLSFEIAP